VPPPLGLGFGHLLGRWSSSSFHHNPSSIIETCHISNIIEGLKHTHPSNSYEPGDELIGIVAICPSFDRKRRQFLSNTALCATSSISFFLVLLVLPRLPRRKGSPSHLTSPRLDIPLRHLLPIARRLPIAEESGASVVTPIP
jgi:hypothetical protein